MFFFLNSYGTFQQFSTSELISLWKIRLLLNFSVDGKQESNGNPKNSSAEQAILVNRDAVSNTENANKRVCSTLDRCYSQNALTVTLGTDDLFPKLNLKGVGLVSCMSQLIGLTKNT